MTQKKQARGYKGKTIVDFETDFNTVPAAENRKGWRVPIMSNGIVAASKLTTDDGTLTGRRDPTKPGVGNVDVSGDLKVPVDAHNFLVHLRSLFGLPTSNVMVADKLLSIGPAVNKGNGKVGLPCAAHGLRAGAPVIIAGSTNYDGAYVLQVGTSTDQLVITKTYTAETFAGDETVSLGWSKAIVGAVRDAGGGKVGLPCAAHGLPVGARLIVAGSAHYDATYTVLRGTTANELLVTATYTAETFTAGEVTGRVNFYDKIFKVGDIQPSMLNEKAFPDLPQYFLERGVKASKLSLSLGGEGTVSATISFMGAGEDKDATSYFANPVEWPVSKFSHKDLSLTEGGAAYSERVTTVSLDLDLGLDGDKYTINEPDKAGERGDITEGDLKITGNLEALFKDVDLVDKAIANTTSSLAFLLAKEGYQLEFILEELVYERTSPSIDGPKGVLEKHAYQGFYDGGASNSSVVVRQRNEIYDMEA